MGCTEKSTQTPATKVFNGFDIVVVGITENVSCDSVEEGLDDPFVMVEKGDCVVDVRLSNESE